MIANFDSQLTITATDAEYQEMAGDDDDEDDDDLVWIPPKSLFKKD